MTNRPKEIQHLIDWLRTPGRELPGGAYGTDASGNQLFCAWICFARLCNHDTRRMYELVESDVGDEIVRLSDKRNPLAVADYLEQQFPLSAP